MAAATSGGPELQGQLLEWLLRPVHAKWSDRGWQATVESPAAFAAEYMAFESGPGGIVIGSRCVAGCKQGRQLPIAIVTPANAQSQTKQPRTVPGAAAV